jgi:hypothetical protein
MSQVEAPEQVWIDFRDDPASGRWRVYTAPNPFAEVKYIHAHSLIEQRDALVKALKLIAAKDGYTNLDPEGDNDKDYGRGAAYAYGVCASIAHAALDRTEGQR